MATVVHLDVNIRVSLRTIEDNAIYAPKISSNTNRAPARKPDPSLRSTLDVSESRSIERKTCDAARPTRTETRKRPTQDIIIKKLSVLEYEDINTYKKNGSLA
jgi:hypothetical protein